jgi:formylmethanofuran dehydrogenase subunit E
MNDNQKQCYHCGSIHNTVDLKSYRNRDYCEECFEKLFVECADCGEIQDRDYVKTYDGDSYCETCFDYNFTCCDRCGGTIERNDAEHIDEITLCTDCYESMTTVCYRCGEVIMEDDAQYVEGYAYCEYCYENHTVTCDRCRERIDEDDAHSDDYISLCDSCHRCYYYRCENCGNFVHRDYAIEHNYEYYCPDCAPQSVIHDYSYKPTPHFYGGADKYALFMGVELEIDNGNDNEYCSDSICHIANSSNEHVYCKNDSSLDDGFEIVSHPMTLQYHSESMPWKRVLKQIKNYGYRSHDAGTCGLHVHVSRKALGNTEEEQDLTIMKILFFVERFWNQMVRFSRRTEAQLARWARRYGIKDTPDELLDRAKGAKRYYAVNLNNSNTIEFRLFRGTLNEVTFFATLQLCHELVTLMSNIEVEVLANMTWNDFVANITPYPELMAYLQTRELIDVKDTPITYSREDALREENSEDLDDSDEGFDDDYRRYSIEEFLFR